ncbi:TauD/TfdA family dioxygenase [Moorena sp. SIO4G3]|uniref:TauD/TfdA family dioxygenase n=1 Tax=Moorena sp. SIO4G3 TaxID=2607821 RepID=UPI00142A8898|nr:TauD/TfdA family dioxygenase [Moorena sp. SIO4G3]NEO80258.1 DUF971 domain-containing protein [Moorena sp. SIO4G3]
MNCAEKYQLSSSSQNVKVQSWQTSDKGIEVDFVSKFTNNFDRVTLPWMWLRDHCQCSECFTSSAQREYDVFIGWEKFRWEEVVVDTDTAGLIIQWQDNHKSYFSYDWLWGMLNLENSVAVDERKYWSDDLPSLDYRSVIDTDIGLRHLVEHLTKVGVCKVIGAKASKAEAAQLMHRIAYLRQSSLGNIIEIKPSINSDYDETHLHTDGAFNYDPPGIKLVQCLDQSTSPWEMIFVDGLALVDRIKSEAPQTLSLLQNNPVSYQYLRQDINLIASDPIVTLDSYDRLKRIRYNPKAQLPVAEQDLLNKQALQAALKQFEAWVEDQSQQRKLSLNSGEMVLWDNWRVLHGGSAMNGNHYLAMCTANMEDFHSRLRVIQNQSYQRPVPQAREKKGV